MDPEVVRKAAEGDAASVDTLSKFCIGKMFGGKEIRWKELHVEVERGRDFQGLLVSFSVSLNYTEADSFFCDAYTLIIGCRKPV